MARPIRIPLPITGSNDFNLVVDKILLFHFICLSSQMLSDRLDLISQTLISSLVQMH
jgi:hypothetical protein